MCRVLFAILMVLSLLASSASAQYPGYAPAQVYARGLGVSVSPYGYQWQTTSVPLPMYSGHASYVLPQTSYQFYGTPYNAYYGTGGFNYSYQLPSIFQGTGSYYVPYGW